MKYALAMKGRYGCSAIWRLKLTKDQVQIRTVVGPLLTCEELVGYTALKIDRVVTTHIGEGFMKMNIILCTCKI